MTIQQWLVGTAEYLRQAQQGILTGSITAAGSTQTTAFQLSTDFNVVTSCSGSNGVLLLGAGDTSFAGTAGALQGPCTVGDTMTIVNHGGNTLLVYPQGTGKIANGSASAAFNVSNTKTAFFVYIGSGNWGASVSA